MKFPIFTIFILFLAFVTYNRIRNDRKDKEKTKEFWNQEEQANATRRKDISFLPYIIIPLDSLPLGIRPEDEALVQYEEQLKTLAQCKILNLTGITNTELKLKYGAPNLTALTEYDNHYTELVRLMQNWGLRLFELSLPTEAEQVLTQAIRWGSDIRATYLLLAQIYRDSGNTDGIRWLKKSANQLNSLMKKPILEALKEY